MKTKGPTPATPAKQMVTTRVQMTPYTRTAPYLPCTATNVAGRFLATQISASRTLPPTHPIGRQHPRGPSAQQLRGRPHGPCGPVAGSDASPSGQAPPCVRENTAG